MLRSWSLSLRKQVEPITVGYIVAEEYVWLGGSTMQRPIKRPSSVSMAIRTTNETSQGVIFDIPVTKNIPELELFTEAMRLLGREEDTYDAPKSAGH